MGIKVGMISLGCAKNQVDGEVLMAALGAKGFETADDVGMSDIAIVNTCGFIESAKRESIEEIMELILLKNEGRIKKIVITGCLAERYREELHRELPEVDAVLGIGANGDIAENLTRMMEEDCFVQSFPEKENLPLEGDRELSTPGFFAYLKIAEGCDNRCTYCAIPLIRGGYRSRTMESIEEEARALAAVGVKELNIIAQDTTRYGLDIYGEYSLAKLLRRLCGIDGIEWIRVLYCYPDAVTDELLDVMREEEKIVKYMDLPLQHVSGKILKAMNRRGDSASVSRLLERIRERVPGVAIRTTLITGFPGETEEDFEELSAFVKRERIDRLGCFAYSQEEGTPAAELPGQIDEETKERRAQLITETQLSVMEEKDRELTGETLTVLTEGFDRYAECCFGRSYRDAPDVDPKIFFSAEPGAPRPRPGEFVKVLIEDAADGDLYGSLV